MSKVKKKIRADALSKEQLEKIHFSPKPVRCTRPQWGPRIAWAAILVSGGYLAARIVPALIAGVN